jgi:hypothetical protein
MKDYSEKYLEIKKLLDNFYFAATAKDLDLAFRITNQLVEASLQLEDIIYENQKVQPRAS